MIGESIHGTAQFPQLREALSLHLARRFGFRILALEGPYASCLNPITSALTRQAFATGIRRCIPSNWYTEESVSALWRLVADPDGPRMKVYGFDIQPTELLPASEYTALVRAAVSATASDAVANDVASAFNTIHEHLWDKTDGIGYLTSNFVRLNQELERLTDGAKHWKTSTLHTGRQILVSETHFLAYWRAAESGDWHKFMVLRDRGMADNLAWIVNANPTEKILVWAQNGHVAMSRSVASDAPTPLMGELVRARFGEVVVSVAMVMGEGSADRRKGQTIVVPAPGSQVVESLMMPYPIAYVLSKQLCGTPPFSSVGHFAIRDNGTIEIGYNCNPSAFDAIFFVRDVSAPKYMY